MKIGIIGAGYVGSAIINAYSKLYDLIIVDTDITRSKNEFYEIFNTAAIFVCVPSPANLDGSCNSSILENVLSKLKSYKNIIICKTTALPNVYEKLSQDFDNLIYVPEFLTAQNHLSDYINDDSAIIGSNNAKCLSEAVVLLQRGQPKLKTVYPCSIKEAAFAKYVENCFLATKVIFMNEMAEIATEANIEWSKISHVLQKDKRIGMSHCQVPGPDGKPGFGGACFPKDTSAFLDYTKRFFNKSDLLSLAVNKNKKWRS